MSQFDLQLLYHSVQLPTQTCPWDTLHAARICNFYITVSNCLHRSVLKTLCMLPESATSISQCPIAYTDLSLKHSACCQDLQLLYHSVQLPTQICPWDTLHALRICNFYITVSNCLHRSVLETLCMLPGSAISISQCPIAYTDLSLKHSARCQDLTLARNRQSYLHPGLWRSSGSWQLCPPLQCHKRKLWSRTGTITNTNLKLGTKDIVWCIVIYACA